MHLVTRTRRGQERGHVTREGQNGIWLLLCLCQTKIRLADCILYVLDARAPFACMNPFVDKIVHNKPIIYVLNKCDLADDERTKEIKKQFIENSF